MKVLVTGASGYIGSHTVVELLLNGYEVIAVDNLSNSNAESLRRAEKITGKEILFYQNDIRDRAAMELIFTAHSIDWVIHFAGLKCVPESVRDPLLYYENNLDSTFVLLNTMKKFGVKRIVFSSSATVYGQPERLPLDESCALAPVNPYGRTKRFQELILKDLYDSDHAWTVVILRYFNPAGAHESGLIGEDPKGIPNNIMPYIAQVASHKLSKIKIFGNDFPTPDGTGIRDYIHVVDLARGHVAALNKIEKSGVYLYNLGTGKGTSVLQLIDAFSKACGKILPYEIASRREGDLPEYYTSCKKAEKELGWKAEFDVEKICLDAWNWQKQNPNGY